MALYPKEQVCSIILCKDKDFKMRTMNLLLDCAVLGAKYPLETLDLAREKFLATEGIGVFVVNGAEYRNQTSRHIGSSVGRCIAENTLTPHSHI